MPLPRGIRSCNPGNIRKSLIPWQGQISGTDPDFCTFSDPKYGIRAIMLLLRRYYYVLGLTTVTQIINRWAPPQDQNNTSAYVNAVAMQMKVQPTDELTICPETYISFAQAVAVHENGTPPITYPPFWYDPTVYQAAYDLTQPRVAPAS